MPDEIIPPLSIRQDVEGDRNQVIGSMSGNAKAIGNIEAYIENQIHQPLPRQLSLHQLPNDIADFTGRETELWQLTQLLQPSGDRTAVVISAVAGMPGVGKSALAIHVAHQLQSQFSDAQLYINLRGTNDQPLEPFEVLGQWLRAFGLADSTLPADLPGRVSTYRSLLAQKRAIVLLDNASSEAQVRDLIPGSSTCAVLITSRRRLTALAGVELLNLPVMPRAEALDMLERLIGAGRVQAEPEAATQILQLCGRLPLAIRIAGGTLKQKRHWSLATYVSKLEEQKQRLAQLQLSDLDVRSSFQLSYQELAETDAHLFQFLGLFPGDFATIAAAALTDQTQEETATALERLVDAQLLEAIREDRYQFHDLIRLFAQEHLDQQQSLQMQQAAQERLVQWYWKQTDFWENVFDPLRRRHLVEAFLAGKNNSLSSAELEHYTFLAGLSWFEVERTNLLTVVTWAEKLQAGAQVVSFAVKLVSFFSIRGYWNDWIQTHQLALSAARRSKDLHGEAYTLTNLGIVYREQGRWQEAIGLFQQSLKISRQLGDRHGEAANLGNLGVVYRFQGRWQEAIDLYQQDLQISHELGNRQGEAQTLGNLGNLYSAQGRWQEAIHLYQQSLQIKHELGDHYGEAQTLGNLGNTYSDQGRWQEAIEIYKHCLKVLCDLGDRQGEAIILTCLGNVYRDQGRWQEAIEIFQKSLQRHRELGNRQGEAQTLTNLGTVYSIQGRWEAIDLYQQSLQIFRELGDRHGEAQTLGNLGLVYRAQGNWQEAIDLFQQSLKVLCDLGDRQGEATILTNLGLVYYDQERWQEAIEIFQQSFQRHRELGDRSGEAQNLNSLGVAYHNQGQWQEAIEIFQQSLQRHRELGDRSGEAQIFNNLGNVYHDQGRWQEAIDLFQQSLKVYRELDDLQGEAITLNNLGVAFRDQERWQEAIDLFQQSLKGYRELGDCQGEAQTLSNLVTIYSIQRHWQKVIELFQQSLKVYRDLGDRHREGQTIANLGVVYTEQNQPDRAIPLWQEALTKLNPDSPEAQEVADWLASPPSQSRKFTLIQGFIGLGVIIFIAFNFFRGHWLIALAAAVLFAGFIAFNYWRSRGGKQVL